MYGGNYYGKTTYAGRRSGSSSGIITIVGKYIQKVVLSTKNAFVVLKTNIEKILVP